MNLQTIFRVPIRSRYTNEFKAYLLEKSAESDMSIRSVSRLFAVNRRSVQKWMSARDAIMSASTSAFFEQAAQSACWRPASSCSPCCRRRRARGRRVPRAVTTSSCARRVTAVSRARGCATACSSGTAIIARRRRRYDASVNDDSSKDQTIPPILLCRRVRFHPYASTSGTIVIAGNCVPTHADGENTTSSNNLTTVENGPQEDIYS